LGQWVVSPGIFRARQHACMVLYIGRFTGLVLRRDQSLIWRFLLGKTSSLTD